MTIGAEGRSVTQARAVGRTDEAEILTVNAALGSRPSFDAEGEWATMPDVPGPDECDIRTHRFEHESVASRMEQRLAVGRPMDELDGTPSDGTLRAVGPHARGARHVRARPWPSSVTSCPSASARPSVCRPAATAWTTPSGSSRLEPTDWVLLDIRVHAVHGGFGHGAVLLWSETGELLAIASQSTIVRFWKDRGST